MAPRARPLVNRIMSFIVAMTNHLRFVEGVGGDVGRDKQGSHALSEESGKIDVHHVTISLMLNLQDQYHVHRVSDHLTRS